ncbi:hypothetical protein AVEN_188635-1, partial [Araneus ventricosus]
GMGRHSVTEKSSHVHRTDSVTVMVIGIGAWGDILSLKSQPTFPESIMRRGSTLTQIWRKLKNSRRNKMSSMDQSKT